MYRLNTDKTAAVSTEFFWLPVTKIKPPGGAKVLLINERYGVAALGHWHPDTNWTHWAPLPRFVRDEEECSTSSASNDRPPSTL